MTLFTIITLGVILNITSLVCGAIALTGEKKNVYSNTIELLSYLKPSSRIFSIIIPYIGFIAMTLCCYVLVYRHSSGQFKEYI